MWRCVCGGNRPRHDNEIKSLARVNIDADWRLLVVRAERTHPDQVTQMDISNHSSKDDMMLLLDCCCCGNRSRDANRGFRSARRAGGTKYGVVANWSLAYIHVIDEEQARDHREENGK